MAKGNEVQVIECNLRASRTFPFVSKTLNCDFISLATRAMCDLDVEPYKISLLDIDYVCVKVRSIMLFLYQCNVVGPCFILGAEIACCF